MLLLLGLALAHPFADHLAPDGTPALGHQLVVSLGEGRLRLEYVAEVPTVVLEEEFGGDDRFEALARERAAELAGGLKARWDGERLPLVEVPLDAPATRGDDGLWWLRVVLEGERPATGTLEVVNGNYPDRFAYYYAEVRVPGDRVVSRTSLAEVRDGRVWNNFHGSWGRNPTARELSVTLRRAWPWERRAGEAALPERLAGTNALAPSTGWRFGAAALLVAGAAGVGWRRVRARGGLGRAPRR